MGNRLKFKNRQEAGIQLAEKLTHLKKDRPLVLALPRGGVEVGFQVAVKLNALLDVMVVRKLGVPGNPEYAIGAIAEGGVMIINNREIQALALANKQLQDIVANETAEMERRIAAFRGNRHNPQVQDRTVILVDDGLATGMTAKAAIESLRLENPKRLVFAVPVSSQDAAEDIKDQVDEFACLSAPQNFYAVGQWYEEFPQLTDQQVIDTLDLARETLPKRLVKKS